MRPLAHTAHFLMCRPRHFAVSYKINPWMDPVSWARNHRALATTSHQQWTRLYDRLRELGAKIEFVPPLPGVPDLVFTANAAVVLDGKALLARFRHPERQREEAHFEAVFRRLQARGIVDTVMKLPRGLVLEGAGDCVWDTVRNCFWMGYGPRSEAAARGVVEAVFEREVLALELADDRFYHMDTAFCPLPGGEVMYVADAFTSQGRAMIREHVARDARVEISGEDAQTLAANAVCVGNTVVTAGCGPALRVQLEARGYKVVITPLTAFLRSGGGAFCLTLRLDGRSALKGRLGRPVAAA